MPTIIALDVSLSMQRTIPGRSEENALTYQQLAVKAISQLLEYLTNNSKLEYVALVCYSGSTELKVDFTRDYEQIRQAAKKVETATKSCFIGLLKFLGNIFQSNWGTQSYCQTVVFTDCGIGFSDGSIKHFLGEYIISDKNQYDWIDMLKKVKIIVVCMGVSSDQYFVNAVALYKKTLDTIGVRNTLFTPRPVKDEPSTSTGRSNNPSFSGNVAHTSHKTELGRTSMFEIVDHLCETNFKPYETILKCGGYFRLESPIIIWPPVPPLFDSQNDRPTPVASKIEVCGYLSIIDIGSPASLSRHLVLAKVERDKRREKPKHTSKNMSEISQVHHDMEKLEHDIREFYAKELNEDEPTQTPEEPDPNKPSCSNVNMPPDKETLCVLLHAVLKMENLAALVLLNNDWYGFIYAHSDSKKKSNLLLNVLPPGNNAIPWLGDLRLLCLDENAVVKEGCAFPIRGDKRSYSQNCVVWIRQASMHADVQKVLRHSKKMPEKTPHFFKELNRIRRAALSFGFIELFEAMAVLFEKECQQLPLNIHPECILQLKHAARELRKPSNLDLKVTIFPAPSLIDVNAVPSTSSAAAAAAAAGGSGTSTGVSCIASTGSLAGAGAMTGTGTISNTGTLAGSAVTPGTVIASTSNANGASVGSSAATGAMAGTGSITGVGTVTGVACTTNTSSVPGAGPASVVGSTAGVGPTGPAVGVSTPVGVNATVGVGAAVGVVVGAGASTSAATGAAASGGVPSFTFRDTA